VTPPAAGRRLLARIDAFLDASPLGSAEPVDVGPLRAFLSRVAWPYYARPRADLDLSGSGAVSARDLTAAADVLRGSGAPVAYEWVQELVPSMESSARESGLDVTLHPLLVLGALVPAATPEGITLDLLDADDPVVAAARVVADLGFSASGTAVGTVGARERDAVLASRDAAADADSRQRIRSGRAVIAVARDHSGVVGVGSHQPIHDVTEIVGVAVLPAYRRRGIAAALTTALAQDAMTRGADVVMLSAGSDAVARVYERVGFTRIGHAGEATPPPDE
jgi:ribosomal protein S18 acetylase RimI-like enzyme